jgi:tripartite-type tricarboxylate transporter receptor subunit TctC
VFVKKGTPDEAVDKLVEAFKTGAEAEDFKKLMKQRGYGIMNLSGEEADSFLENYRAVSSWVVFDAGIAKHSPEDFGIKRPE